MELQEARAKYHILWKHAGGILARSDEDEIIDILNASDDKHLVIAAFQEKIETIHPSDLWRRAKFVVALNDLRDKPSRD